MKKNSVLFTLFAFLCLAATSLNGQVFSEELRPFDFTDKYYQDNGIIASTLVDRKNGADGKSVIDKTDIPYFNDIRILETLPAYSTGGSPIFYNYYGGASRESFTTDISGGDAVTLAYEHPMYVFPSTTVRASDRQAAVIDVDESYFDKNLIGISAVFLVEYTDRIFTKSGHAAMQLLASRNGLSVDGTPIIKTARELEGLSTDGLVTIRQAGPENSDRQPFAIAKVIQNPEAGAIAPDAFLVYTKEPDGDPLAAETHLISMFECLKAGGGCVR